LDLLESIYKQVKKTCYMSAGFASRHVVGFGDLSVDFVLEVQNKRYSQILYLIDYIAHGLQGHVPKTYFPTSWLSDKSVFYKMQVLGCAAAGPPANKAATSK
jgi:hypothetical protein